MMSNRSEIPETKDKSKHEDRSESSDIPVDINSHVAERRTRSEDLAARTDHAQEAGGETSLSTPGAVAMKGRGSAKLSGRSADQSSQARLRSSQLSQSEDDAIAKSRAKSSRVLAQSNTTPGIRRSNSSGPEKINSQLSRSSEASPGGTRDSHVPAVNGDAEENGTSATAPSLVTEEDTSQKKIPDTEIQSNLHHKPPDVAFSSQPLSSSEPTFVDVVGDPVVENVVSPEVGPESLPPTVPDSAVINHFPQDSQGRSQDNETLVTIDHELLSVAPPLLSQQSSIPDPFSDYPGEQYPAMDIGQLDIPVDDSGGIRAFVADTVVDATGVAVVLSEEDEEKLERRKYRCMGLSICLCLLVVVVSVVTPVLLRGSGSFSTFPPSPSPSPVPSASPTSPPTTDSFYEAIQVIIDNNVSSPDALFAMGTPQNLAVHWIANEDGMERPAGHPQFIQRYVAAVFYFSTGGDDWFRCDRKSQICDDEPFLSHEDECEWFGIRCTNSQIRRVRFGTIQGNNLDGTIPVEMCQLPQMVEFYVPNNLLKGTLPSCFGNLQNFQILVLSNNQMGSPLPKSLFELPNMTQLTLDRNKFSEEFPDLSKMPLLNDFRAYFNSFKGSFKAGIANLENIVIFEVDNNDLTGGLPEDFAYLPKLEFLKVNNNTLGGSFPELIFEHTNLRRLWVSNNSFVGTIPESVENFGRENGRRKEINLDGNNFNGKIPTEMGNINFLRQVNLKNNDFTGVIPLSMCAITGEGYSQLSLLEVDCSEVSCGCCTNC